MWAYDVLPLRASGGCSRVGARGARCWSSSTLAAAQRNASDGHAGTAERAARPSPSCSAPSVTSKPRQHTLSRSGGVGKVWEEWAGGTLGAAAAVAVAWGAVDTAFPDAALATSAVEQYEAMSSAASSLSTDRGTPNQEAYKKELFTEDAWEGMLKLQEYARLVDEHAPDELVCGDECSINRDFVEAAWQTVSNEFFDDTGKFTQAKWSEQLYSSMKEAGVVLHTRGEAYRVVQKMMASLNDPYSMFLTPEEYRKQTFKPTEAERRYLQAQYSGVGLQLGPASEDGGLVIMAPLAGSPAEEAGIRPKDRLLGIDDVPVGPGIMLGGYRDDEGLGEAAANGLLRGPPGSPVKLTLASGSDGTIQRKLLARRFLPRPPVEARFVDAADGGKVQYIRVFFMNCEATAAFQQALLEGEAAGVEGYVIDVRNNPGGVFEEAVSMASMLLSTCPTNKYGDNSCDVAYWVNSVAFDGSNDGNVIDFVYNNERLTTTDFPLQPKNISKAPVVVVANAGSASSAEVFAGALRDNGRAPIVGETTFGKGRVQYFYNIKRGGGSWGTVIDGSGLKLTVAKYLSPTLRDISRQGGIAPDVECHDFNRAVDGNSAGNDECILKAVSLISS